uniref:Urotensin II-related peptide n=1 Tax=Mastacembelus armatus TaxID=205130 RepID=A0A7N8X0A6_9TELE
SLALNPGQYLRQWFWSAKAARVDGTTKSADKTSVRSITGGTSAGRLRINPETTGPDKRTQMLKMISALEELHRMFNSTLSSRITIMPRGNTVNSLRNGRNSAKKNKSVTDSTASRASSDVVVPSLTGRNFRKSLSPQPKKTNKRVCFWKYCSQN